MKALVITAGVLFAAACAPPAFAPGDASWIMLDPKTRSCCGPDDCRRMVPGEVVEEGAGWTVVAAGEHLEGVTTLLRDSIDANFWICRYHGPDGTPGIGGLRCLLVPRAGS